MDRSANMRAIRSKGMKPEMLVRRMLHALGYRYRLHQSDLSGKPDLVFPARQKVIFVHGCFWHSHSCQLAHEPKSNVGYWLPKLSMNKKRDKAHLAALKSAGWKVLIIWECKLKHSEQLLPRIVKFLGRSTKYP